MPSRVLSLFLLALVALAAPSGATGCLIIGRDYGGGDPGPDAQNNRADARVPGHMDAQPHVPMDARPADRTDARKADRTGIDADDDDAGDPGETENSWSFFAFGDSRECSDILEKNVRSMVAIDPSAIAGFNSGDLTLSGAAGQWEEHIGAVTAGGFRVDATKWGPYTRYIGVLGNHDVQVFDWYQNWNHYLPAQKDFGFNTPDGVFFALSYENALFIVMDSVHAYHSGLSQLLWLESVLRTSTAEWKFAFFHHPVYPCNAKAPFAEGLAMVQLFEEYGLDIAFTGHSHTYERTCPMRYGKCEDGDPGGVVYLQSSGGGAPTREVFPTLRGTVSLSVRADSYDCLEILQSYYTNNITEIYPGYCAYYPESTATDDGGDMDAGGADPESGDAGDRPGGEGFFTHVALKGCRLTLRTYTMHRDLVDTATYDKCD